MPRTEDEIRIGSHETDGKGSPLTHTTLSPTTDTRQRAILAQPTAVIPIIFLPGIMGTNLKSNTGSKVWRPPNTDGVFPILGAMGQMFAYVFRGPATRQRMLDPSKVEVDDRGSIDTDGALKKSVAKDRGWGAVMRSSYHPVMALMQKRLNNIMEAGGLLEWWNENGTRSPGDYGDEKAGPALSGDDFKHAASYRYEVWGGGYNWLQSNEDSGQDLIDYIDDVVLAHHRSKGQDVKKVILVTHSMGGLVGRAIARVHEYGKLLGVVHGVMPATGAPATYHHCRCGYDGVSQIILGRNAKEVTAIVGNAPGALELLPSADYGEGRAWLKLGGPENNPSHALPISDPYTEIYHSREWYGLVPQESLDMLDPASLHNEPEFDGAEAIGFERFTRLLNDTQCFHESISGKYPQPAFVHYGADDRLHGWADVHWQGPQLPSLNGMTRGEDNGNGKLSLKIGEKVIPLNFGEASQPGDGTVPTISGEAPLQSGVSASFRQGNQGSGAFVATNEKGKNKGYDHQDSYNDSRSQWATLVSVASISLEADWA
ncbi:esterase/lipase family protein [Novilysobacter antarcticus]|uniref:esterase/lipase family protein n=1 Tax=Novilysobacter antarcticus TaxID=2862543 RepID=UPI001C9929C2|nr:hypothetical protein [Lysobacter antarcticus]